MSTPDDQTKEVTKTSSPAKEESSEENASGGFIILFFIIGLVASFIVGWIIFPKLLYSKKNQPIDFNHEVHMGLVEDGCESCHFFREDGTYAGVPKLAQCIECHEEVQGESESEAIFVAEYVEKQKEVPWLLYSKQPDCVFFSHVIHVKTAGLDCVQCHGHVGESTNLKPYEENRITGYSRDIYGKNMLGYKKNPWDKMKMDDCADCHKEMNVAPTSVQTEKDACFVCHK